MRWEYFIIPAILIITGVIMLMIPTSTVFAYKMKTASANEQTQEFCNVLSARIMIAIGVTSAIALALTRNAETGLFGFKNMSDSVTLIALAALVLTLAIPNICCKKKFPELFDKDKNAKQ